MFQAKINHGFWETWRTVERLRNSNSGLSPVEIDRSVKRRFLVEGGFLDEMEDLLNTWAPPPDGPYLSCSADAFPGEETLAPLPPTPRAEIEEILSRKAPAFSLNSDGMDWKRAVLDGSVTEFLKTIGEQQVVVIGPSHLRAHAHIWNWRDVHFLEIHPTEARKDRYRLLQRLIEKLTSVKFSTVLLQCGSLSAWLVAKLYCPNATYSVFDLGRALDFVDPGVVLRQPWGAAHTQTLAWLYGKSIDAWREWIDRKLIAFPTAPNQISVLPAGPVKFVERKGIDFPRLKGRLADSEVSGHWANFGPAVEEFERAISIRERLTSDVVPVTASSGTAALWVAAGVAAIRHGGPVRWVVSSFGFFSSALGPLARAQIVDCDTSGMLSLSALDELDDGEYDGIIVTDLFGRSNVEPYIRFAREHGKRLVIDAAASWGRELYRSLDIPVAFSFHHTKPAGFGEGGCLFVRRADAELARSITNYGHDLPDYVRPYCGNWKLSDTQAALIADRHASSAMWGPMYRLQYLRLRQIAMRLGMNVLESDAPVFGSEAVAPPASIALLMDSAVQQDSLDTISLPFVARKYYRPLEPTLEAQYLYDRIVCIPTHPNMSGLSNRSIREGMKTLLTVQERE